VIRSLISILILFSPGVLYSQFDFDNYLGSARSDINVHEIQNKLEYLGENKITSPVLNRIEMRFQTDDLNLSPEDLRLRVSPTNPFEISMNKQYHKIQVNKLYNDLQFNLNLALRIRYDLLINYLYIKEKITLLNEEAIRLKDELAVIRGDSEFEPLDVEGIVDMELNSTELLIDQTEYASRLNKELIAIKLLFQFNGDIPMDINDLISVENLTSLLAEITPAPDSTNIYVSNAISDFDLRTGKYQVDMAEARRNMDSLKPIIKQTEPSLSMRGLDLKSGSGSRSPTRIRQTCAGHISILSRIVLRS